MTGRRTESRSTRRLPDRICRGRIGIAATIALAFLLAGCGATGKTDYAAAKERSQAYVAAHPDLAPEVAAAIRANTIRKGMTMEQVIAAWGKPAVVQRFRDGAVEQWYFGCDWPNLCTPTNRLVPESFRIDREPADIYSSRALFENGVVVDWRT